MNLLSMVGWALLDLLAIKKCLTDMHIGQSDWGNSSNEASFPQVILVCVRLTLVRKVTNTSPNIEYTSWLGIFKAILVLEVVAKKTRWQVEKWSMWLTPLKPQLLFQWWHSGLQKGHLNLSKGHLHILHLGPCILSDFRDVRRTQKWVAPAPHMKLHGYLSHCFFYIR